MSPTRVARGQNPLRDPHDKRLPRIAGPCGLVLFGVTGDLARKKIMPAIYDLANRGLLPPGFSLVGFARRDWADEDFSKIVHESVRAHARTPFRENVWRNLAEGFRFVPGTFDDPVSFDLLRETVQNLDRDRGTGGNHAFYLSVPPAFFSTVCEQLDRSGLSHGTETSWRRVVIEKPFGHDLKSARELNSIVQAVFPPDSVFRIDHYLGKETVQNIFVFRFANAIFEPVWTNRYVDHVQITVAESIGVENRGAFYEETGASRDILQNHLLQLMSLVAMEPPATFEADALRDEKVKVIRAIGELTPDQIESDVVRGQYGPGWVAAQPVKGYREELEVDAESETETYVAARFEVDDWRWSGVPFYLRAGKRLPKRTTEIAIQFKEVPHRLFRESSTEPDPNLLAIRIQPDEGIMLRFGAKVPGLGIDVRSVTMDFTYGSAFSVDSPDAYETLILDALLGDASLFTRADEVEGAWARVTPIIDSWAEAPPPEFPNYEAGTWGPDAADQLLAREGRRWRRI